MKKTYNKTIDLLTQIYLIYGDSVASTEDYEGFTLTNEDKGFDLIFKETSDGNYILYDVSNVCYFLNEEINKLKRYKAENDVKRFKNVTKTIYNLVMMAYFKLGHFLGVLKSSNIEIQKLENENKDIIDSIIATTEEFYNRLSKLRLTPFNLEIN